LLSEVQGQAEGVRFLRRVIEGHLTSPLLLVGPEGVGRRFSILEAAKEEFSASGYAEHHCLQIDKGVHPDILVLQPPEDAKEIGVQEIRDMIEVTSSFPSSAPTRYVIIDGADALTPSAANAFLKTLEEPPAGTRFFLLAENGKKVIPTIRSRCGELRYKPLPEQFIADYLLQHTNDPSKALVYARISDGSVGRAIQYLGSGRLTLRDEMLSLIKLGLGGDLSSLFSSVGKIGSLRLGLRFLEHILHDLIMISCAPATITNVDIAAELAQVRAQLGDRRVWNLFDGLRAVQRLQGPINLNYHVKSYLASAFSE
jgi:hypothetical protein